MAWKKTIKADVMQKPSIPDTACSSSRHGDQKGDASSLCGEVHNPVILLDLPEAIVLADPSYHARVFYAGTIGRVKSIRQCPVSKGRVYRVDYDDGDLQDLSPAQVKAAVFNADHELFSTPLALLNDDMTGVSATPADLRSRHGVAKGGESGRHGGTIQSLAQNKGQEGNHKAAETRRARHGSEQRRLKRTLPRSPAKPR